MAPGRDARRLTERETRFAGLIMAALPDLIQERLAQGEPRLYRSLIPLLELPLLIHVLELTGGNQLKAARLLGINRNTLRKRLRLLGIAPRR